MAMSRRAFVGTMATGAALGFASSVVGQGVEASPEPHVCVFSKHLQFLGYMDLAKACVDAGVDGVDLTVRAGGHVLPENLDTDLPRAADAIRSAGIALPMISTRLQGGSDPDARAILEAARKSNISFVRIDGGSYDSSVSPVEQLPRITEELRLLTAIARDNGVTLGFHNHSGANRIGSVIWDLHQLIVAVDSPHFGSNFDVGHTTVVGGLQAWDLHARLLAPYVKMMAVKDFVWEGDKARWVPLGQGIVKTSAMLTTMKNAGFSGPISMHFEYKIDQGDMVDEVRSTAIRLRAMLREAGY